MGLRAAALGSGLPTQRPEIRDEMREDRDVRLRVVRLELAARLRMQRLDLAEDGSEGEVPVKIMTFGAPLGPLWMKCSGWRNR